LGAEGTGANVFKASMIWERACLFAAWIGVMERQLERVIAFARERKQFGKPIGKHQAISHRIADMKLRLEAARLLLYRACWAKDSGADPTLPVALAKLAVSEAIVQTSLDSIQIHGGLGVMTETGLERGLRDAISGTIYSGTSEIQRELVARSLGL
jgi:alkylation response protein AidB-like acyl-CoA dehydrogenase